MRYISTLICLLFIGSAAAQTGTITGQIVEQGSGLPIADVHIGLLHTDVSTVSDASGRYTLEDVPAGNHQLLASVIGYNHFSADVVIRTDEIQTFDVRMQEAILELPNIEVNAYSSTGGRAGSLRTPGSFQYISALELQALQTTNVNDVLASVPGVQIIEEEGFGLRPNIGIRGSGTDRSSKIAVLEDGILAAPAPYAAPSAYFFPAIARMSGVEIRKGSSQILFGPNTTAGVINLISTPIPGANGGALNLNAGNYGFREIHGHYGFHLGQFSALIEGLQYASSGFKNIENSDQNTGFERTDGLVKLRWTSAPASKIYQSLSFKMGESSERSDETYLGLTRDDFNQNPYRRYAASQEDEMKSRHRQTALRYLVNPVENGFFQVTGYSNTFHRNWYKLDKVSAAGMGSVSIVDVLRSAEDFPAEYETLSGRSVDENAELAVKANNRHYLSRGIQAKANYHLNTHRFEAGARYHYDEMDRFQWVDVYGFNAGDMVLDQAGIPGTESNRIESAAAWSAYTNYTTEWERWVLEAGLRFEDITMRRIDYGKEDTDRTGSQASERENRVHAWIPGLSLQYKASEHARIFGGIHRGFTPPGSTPGTRPELSFNAELGYRYRANHRQFTVTAYRNQYANLLGADLLASGGQGTGDLFNGGEALTWGIEADLADKIVLGRRMWIPVSGQLSYTHSAFSHSFDSEFEPWGSVTAGDFLPYVPRVTAQISSGLHLGKWDWSLRGDYMSAMRTQAGQGEFTPSERIDARFVLSSAVSCSISKQCTLSAGVRNILNSVYAVAMRPAGWRPGPPRQFNVGVSAVF